ncbi:MAG: hypothetical protein NWE78_03350 [Candidatus Bathyarchaeota archaeon]|nr:hypothetical protein [Candidatus Bathyarchaeota archaeon]
MSQEATPSRVEVTASLEQEKQMKLGQSMEKLVNSLRAIQDDIGQICELASEEKTLVTAFFESLSKFMKPLAPTMSVSRMALGGDGRNVVQANVDSDGHLMILYEDGRVELKNLREEANRDLMICVAKDMLPKFKQLTALHRQKIEFRVRFLSSVTKELQKISNSLSKTESS